MSHPINGPNRAESGNDEEENLRTSTGHTANTNGAGHVGLKA